MKKLFLLSSALVFSSPSALVFSSPSALVCCFLVLFLPAARAEEPVVFQVEVDPAVYPKEAFAAPGVKTADIAPRVKRPDSLPGRKERELAFARVPGLAADIANMDELDRDVLFVRARTKPMKELQKFYPDIAKAKLSKLRKELR